MITGAITWLLRGWLSRWALTAEGEIKAGWRWLTSSAVHFLSFALALSLFGNWVLLERGNRYRDELERVHALQAKATADQQAVNHAPAAKSQAIAEKSDAEAPPYYRAVHAAADAHRVRVDALGHSPAGVPGADPAAASIHGPADTADLVCRSRAEDDLIVAAAARAAEMLAVAQGWMIDGLAVPADPVSASSPSGPPPAPSDSSTSQP